MRTTCTGVSEREVARLRECSSTPTPTRVLSSLDQISEYLIFRPIADLESSQLGCMLSQARRIRDNLSAQELAVGSTCQKLELLKDVDKNQKTIERWIASYTASTDRRIRRISDEEFSRNQRILDELKNRRTLYREIESSLRASDVLLSSPRIFRAVKQRFEDGVFSSADSSAEACQYLRRNVRTLLNDDVADLKRSKSLIDQKLSTSDWHTDESFLRGLWASGSRDRVWQNFAHDAELRSSTFCRMEGRYGRGAATRDQIYNLAVLTAGGGAAMLGRLVGLAAYGGRAEATVAAARVGLGVDISLTTALAAKQAFEACAPSATVASTQRSCAATNDNQFIALFQNDIRTHDCVLSASLTLASAGLLGYSVTRVFAGASSLQREAAEGIGATQEAVRRLARSSEEAAELPEGAVSRSAAARAARRREMTQTIVANDGEVVSLRSITRHSSAQPMSVSARTISDTPLFEPNGRAFMESARFRSLGAADQNLLQFRPAPYQYAEDVSAANGGSSFVVAGRNSSETLRAVPTIAGRELETIDRGLYPTVGSVGSRSSTAGFINNGERFRDVLIKDNDFVLGRGLSHQQVADPLLAMMENFEKLNHASRDRYLATRVSYNGREYLFEGRVIGEANGGSYTSQGVVYHNGLFGNAPAASGWVGDAPTSLQMSPFLNDQLSSNWAYKITDIATGRQLQGDALTPHMIHRYGFYQSGRFRMDPQNIIDFFQIRAAP